MSKKNYTKSGGYPKDANKPESPEEEETTDFKPKKGRIANATLVNLRKKPSMDKEVVILGTVGVNEEFEILVKLASFWKVKTSDERVGFLSSEFCEEVN